MSQGAWNQSETPEAFDSNEKSYFSSGGSEMAVRQLAAILERITDAFYALDCDWRFIYVNAPCERYLGKNRDELLGRVVWDVFPKMRETAFFTKYQYAMQHQETTYLEAYSPVVGRWLEAHAYPALEGLSVYFRDVTERHQAHAEREKLLREAQEANRIKDEFLAIVSHELRTPLNAIMGWAHLLGTAALSEEDAKRGLEAIERNAKAQSQIVEDILDVSRIVTGKMRLKTALLTLDPMLEATLDTVRPMAESKGITLHGSLDPSVGIIQGDAARLQQVFWNLLSNAIKFTPVDGDVYLTLVRQQENAVVQVRDTGSGIEPEFLPHVFDRFRQADMSSTRAFGGLGLGLAIVRQLVELHQGTIHAHSEGQDMGATFTVEIPLAQLQDEAVMASHPIVLDSVVKADDIIPVRPRPLDGIRILLVDDQPDTRQLLTLITSRAGAIVREADSAEAVLAAWDDFTPQVLLSDIGMPDHDGYWLITQVRARETSQKKSRVPAIALTAYTLHRDQERALSVGFERHLAKPVNPTELIKTIRELVK